MLPPQYELVWLRQVESELRNRITEIGFTPMTAKALTGAVSEIINNVWQHAQATSRGSLAYQVGTRARPHRSSRSGNRRAQQPAHQPPVRVLTTSMAALKKAMAVGVSRYDEARTRLRIRHRPARRRRPVGRRTTPDRPSHPRVPRNRRPPTRHDRLRRRPPRTYKSLFTCGNKPPAAPIDPLGKRAALDKTLHLVHYSG